MRGRSWGIDAWLVESLWPAAPSGVADCLDAGILVMSGAQLRFRHEFGSPRCARGAGSRPGRGDVTSGCSNVSSQPAPNSTSVASCTMPPPPDARSSSLATASMQPAKPQRSELTGKRRRIGGRTLEYGGPAVGRETGGVQRGHTPTSSTSPGQIAEAQSMRERALELRLGLQDRVHAGDNMRWLSRIALVDGRQTAGGGSGGQGRGTARAGVLRAASLPMP